MEILNKMRKGQSLPLNTIVIAILVIIVLLVIIVFFTTKVGDSGKTLEEVSDSIKKCDKASNPAFTVFDDVVDATDEDTCSEGTLIPGTQCCGIKN